MRVFFVIKYHKLKTVIFTYIILYFRRHRQLLRLRYSHFSCVFYLVEFNYRHSTPSRCQTWYRDFYLTIYLFFFQKIHNSNILVGPYIFVSPRHSAYIGLCANTALHSGWYDIGFSIRVIYYWQVEKNIKYVVLAIFLYWSSGFQTGRRDPRRLD